MFVGQTSPATRNEIIDMRLEDRLELRDAVPDRELAWFYAHCEALIVAGHDEGFCIPVAEASAFGKPVFAPQAATLYPAIFGDLVIPLDMNDPQAGADQLIRHLHAPADLSAGERVARAGAWSKAAFDTRVRAAISGLSDTAGARTR